MSSGATSIASSILSVNPEPDHDHDRLCRRRGRHATSKADRGEGDADGSTVLIATATVPDGRWKSPQHLQARTSSKSGRLPLGRSTKYLAVHDCGRIMNPLTATSQIKGGAIMGLGMALHEDLIYDRRSGVPLTPGYYGARVPTHRDAPDIEVLFIESDDGYGPFGAKSMGEASKVPAVAAVGNAVFNAIGHRMKDLPITRDKILAAVNGQTPRGGVA
jgi:hypothetical protein